jgi:hypothetical protein
VTYTSGEELRTCRTPSGEAAMPGKKKKSGAGEYKPGLIEVWLSDPDQKRPPFGHETQPLEYLPADGPLPRPGDIIHLPRNVTGDTKKQAFGFGGTRSPFRVVECSYVYHREKGETFDPLDPKPALHVKTTMHVMRLTPKEVYDDRGWEREPGT